MHISEYMHSCTHRHICIQICTHRHTNIQWYTHTHMYTHVHTHAYGFICSTFVGIAVNSSKLILGFLSWTAIKHTLWFPHPWWRHPPLFGFLCQTKRTATQRLGTSGKKIGSLLRLHLFVFPTASTTVRYRPWANIWKSIDVFCPFSHMF